MQLLKINISKATLTNSIAVSLIGVGLAATAPISKPLLYTGLFAFSGAITNQVAIYMLFNKVPFLYGSGVIEDNFESFKKSIKDMIMKQFFNKEQLETFFANEEQKINLVPLIEKTDFSPAFDALKQSVLESKFGEMLNLFGGEKALDGLKEPFAKKLKSAVISIVSSQSFQSKITQHLSSSLINDDIINTIDDLITKRLNELTPKMVNNLVHELIHTHLGWLVVWGGIFGGIIGLGSSFLL